VQNVLHTKTPEDPSSWIVTTPVNSDRTFTGFAEVKGTACAHTLCQATRSPAGEMVGVGASSAGPIAVSRPANPFVWSPITNEPPSDIALTAIVSNYTVGAIAAGVQVAVGYVRRADEACVRWCCCDVCRQTIKNMTTYGVILMSLKSVVCGSMRV
jgi:hypothetical protein